jgi:predicted ATP-dependent endonuclease of OLD family
MRIQNFKSVLDSGPVGVDEVTCLVGKNESGKSAVLDALYKLNPVESEDTLNELDFPRGLFGQYTADAGWKQQDCVTTVWQIEQVDRDAAVKIFGFDPYEDADLLVTLKYDNVRYLDVKIAESRVVQNLMAQAGLDESERQTVNALKGIDQAAVAMSKVKEPTTRQQNFSTKLDEMCPASDRTQLFRTFMNERLPKIIKFSDYYLLPGRVALNDLRTHQQKNALKKDQRVFLALLSLAGRSLETMMAAAESEHHIAALEATSNRLTEEILEYWTTNDQLTVQFRCEPGRVTDPPPLNSGLVFETRIHNTRHRVTINFDERSTGFIWFFSFLVWFSQIQEQYGDNLLILLDEPGLNLHGRAQADLLRYMNHRLKPKHQVIYTTHSPFLVDPDALLSVRTVEDKSDGRKVLGTKVSDLSSEVEEDTVLPLMGALGVGIIETLFDGSRPLLVEGPRDLLVMSWFSQELRARGREGLDTQWNVTPVGGLAKVGSVAALLGPRVRNVAAIINVPLGANKELDRAQAAIMKRGHVLRLDTYAGQPGAEIEDMIGRPMFIGLLTDAYGIRKADRLPERKPAEAPSRLVQEAADKFRLLRNYPRFDPLEPARFLNAAPRQRVAKYPGFNEALSRFEKLFQDLNTLLTTAPMKS